MDASLKVIAIVIVASWMLTALLVRIFRIK